LAALWRTCRCDEKSELTSDTDLASGEAAGGAVEA
jgi:hypothetical protein